MKTTIRTSGLVAIMASLAISSSSPAFAEEEEQQSSITGNFGLSLGYTGVSLSGSTWEFAHNTHPQDAFLPGSGIPGSAGKTSLEGDLVSMFSCAATYQWRFLENFTFGVEAGYMFGEDRVEQANANDSRPASGNSRVYSQLTGGVFAGAEVDFHFANEPMKGFFVGLAAHADSLTMESGWNRWGADQPVEKDTTWVATVGPTFGWEVENMAIKGSILFGSDVTEFGLAVSYKF